MIRFVIRTVVFLGSAALGLLVAKALVDEMTIDWADLVWVVVIFAVLQSVLAPFIAKTASRNAPAVLGATGLISTVVALLITSVVTGLRISGGPGPWIYASVVVWIVTMLAALLLPVLLVKSGVQRRRTPWPGPDAEPPS